MERVKLRELLEQFVRTEVMSSSLMECLDARLAEALSQEIDTEVVRNSLTVPTVQSPPIQKLKNSPISNNNGDFSGFWLDDKDNSSQTSSSTSTSPLFLGHPPTPLTRKIHGIADELARSSSNFRTFRIEAMELCKQVVHELWRLGRNQMEGEKDGKIMAENGKKKFGGGSKNNKKQSHLNGFFDSMDSALPSTIPIDSVNFCEENDDEDSEANERRDSGEEVKLALSSFSLGHSMQELPEEEMQNIVSLICSDGVEKNVRLTNIRKLHFVSPMTFSKSKAFEIFLGHLHAILPIPLLFNDTMNLLARIMNCPNEMIWLRCVTCLSRVALGIMRSSTLGQEDKRAFTDFICQLLALGPHIWRYFVDPQNVANIVQSFMEMLTAEISAGGGGGPTLDGLLAMMARVDPQLSWAEQWLHRQSVRKMMMPKFAELVHEVLEHHIRPSVSQDQKPQPSNGDPSVRQSPFYWAFQCSILFRCLQDRPLFTFLHEIIPDPGQLRLAFCRSLIDFLTIAFTQPGNGQRPNGFSEARTVVAQGLINTTMTDCGASVLCSDQFLFPLFNMPLSVPNSSLKKVHSSSASHSSSSLLSSPSIFDLPLRVLLNLLSHSPSIPSPELLPKVEKALRQHLALFQYHIDSSFATELPVKVLNHLFECFPADQLLPLFTDLIYTILIPRITRLDPANPDHTRLIIGAASLTVWDNQNPHQWRQWRKTVGRSLNTVGISGLDHARLATTISPAHPNQIWLTFPLAMELSDNKEKRHVSNVLLQFLGSRKEETKNCEKQIQNGESKRRRDQRLHPNNVAQHSTSSIVSSEEACPSTNVSSAEDNARKFMSKSITQRPNCLDFLASAPTEYRKDPQSGDSLPASIFLMITQPGLIPDLFHSAQFGHHWLEHLTVFERQKSSEEQLAQFVGRMDFLIANLDVLVELKHFVPNLSARLVQLLHKYCSDSTGSLFLSELTRKVCLFLSHSNIAAPSERRFREFRRMGEVRKALKNVPESLYKQNGTVEKRGKGKEKIRKLEEWKRCEEEEEEDEEEETDEEGDAEGRKSKTEEKEKEDDWMEGWEDGGGEEKNSQVEDWDEQLKEKEKMKLDEGGDADEGSGGSTIGGLRLEAADAQFWFAVLPEKDTPGTRLALLRSLFSPNWRQKQRRQIRPFEILKAFAERHWPRPEQNRMSEKPPPHSEWLGLLADYANALGIARGNRAQIRQRMIGLRLLPSPSSQPNNDWFLSAVFLSSGLNVDGTMDFCERLLGQQSNASSLSTMWPHYSSSSGPNSFNDLLARTLLPRILSRIRLNPSDFRHLFAFLCSSRLPSLFHLLLFFTSQSFLGILPFRAVEECLLAVVLGGPEIQAIHFCALLMHILRRSNSRLSMNFSAKLTSLFLRPEHLANFNFSKYVHLLDEENDNISPQVEEVHIP